MTAATGVSIAASVAALACAVLAVRFARKARGYRADAQRSVEQARLLQLNPGDVLETVEGIRAAMTDGFTDLGYAPADARHLADVAFESWLDYVRKEA